MATNGFDLRERPWQPGLDDARFNQQPRNPNFAGGASPEAAAYQRARGVQGLSTTERPWTNADTRSFGTRPAGAPTPLPERLQGAADAFRGRVDGARAGVAKSQADRAATAASAGQPGRVARAWNGAKNGARGAAIGSAVTNGFGDYKIDDPSVDSSMGGTLRALGSGDFSGAGRSLSKGALETLMDLGSSATNLVDGVTSLGPQSWQTDLSGTYDRALRSQFGDQLITPARREDALNAPAPSAGVPAVSTGAPNPTDQRLAAGAQTPPGVSAPGGAQGSLPAPTNNVTRVGNSYSGGNIAGDITINGQAPGGGAISPQNMAAADALAQRDSLRSAGAVMAGQGGGQGFPVAPRVQHSGNNWQAENNLRNLRVSASSITNDGGRFDRHRGVSPAALAYIDAQRADTVRRGAQPGLDMETIKTNNSLRGQMFDAQSRADAARYASDNSLRGDIYRADGAERSARMSAAAAAQKQASDDVIRQNDLDIKNTDRTRQRFSVFDKEGKLDEAATNQALLAMDKIAPGFSRMSEDARGKSLPHADALFNLYNRTRQGRELGLGQAVFGNSNPPADSMPDFKGGRLKRQGLTGVLPGQAGKDGYFIEMPDGREISLGRGLSETELGLLRRNMQTGTWKD